jgi:hypothetical protein
VKSAKLKISFYAVVNHKTTIFFFVKIGFSQKNSLEKVLSLVRLELALLGSENMQFHARKIQL